MEDKSLLLNIEWKLTSFIPKTLFHQAISQHWCRISLVFAKSSFLLKNIIIIRTLFLNLFYLLLFVFLYLVCGTNLCMVPWTQKSIGLCQVHLLLEYINRVNSLIFYFWFHIFWTNKINVKLIYIFKIKNGK